MFIYKSNSHRPAAALLPRLMPLNGVGGGLGHHRLKSRHFGCACAVPPNCCISSARWELRQASKGTTGNTRHIQYKVTLIAIIAVLYDSIIARNDSNVNVWDVLIVEIVILCSVSAIRLDKTKLLAKVPSLHTRYCNKHFTSDKWDNSEVYYWKIKKRGCLKPVT